MDIPNGNGGWPSRSNRIGRPVVTGLDVVVTANGQITALYTFVDPPKR